MPLGNSIVTDSIDLLQKLIQNKCVNPPGNELKSAQTVKSVLDEYDIKSTIYETDSTNNRGNLVAKIEGTGEGPNLMFGPSHIDVVPISKPTSWEVNPFGGVIKDEFVWGRGALDMLFIVATQVQAFVKLKEEGFQPKGDLTLLIVSDEESGANYGAKWMKENHPEIMNVDYALGEAGGIPINEKSLLVTTAEKGLAWRRVLTKGIPGHGSTPYKSDNAAVNAGIVAKKLANYNPPSDTKYLRDFTKGMKLNILLRLLLNNKLTLPLILRILNRSNAGMAKTFHAMTHMTISPNVIQAGNKTNVIPGEGFLKIDIRTLPNQDDKYVDKHLRKALGKLTNKVSIDIPEDDPDLMNSPGSGSELTPDIYEAMQNAISDYYQDVRLVPFIASGGTDLRFVRDLGGKAYGFSLFDPDTDPNDISTLSHAPNERISLKTVEMTLNAYYNIARELLK
jgi:acetylornithine deacetylase/succinyl-diaminopimelate desuccinylase-like protein